MQTTGPSLSGVRLVLAVTGSIAAYKAVSLLRLLRREAATVNVVMTAGACRFVTRRHLKCVRRACGDRPLQAHREMLPPVSPGTGAGHHCAGHRQLPCKAALGLADDLLSTMLLATTQCPVIFAPAMDGDMWQHPTVVEHVAALRARGAIIVEPEDGPLASRRHRAGRLADEELESWQRFTTPFIRAETGPAARCLISAGPTQEAIDLYDFSQPVVRDRLRLARPPLYATSCCLRPYLDPRTSRGGILSGHS